MYVKFKNNFKSISIMIAVALTIVIGSAVVFGSISDVANQNSIKLTKNTKISDEFQNATNEKN